jgi:signal transduction histidine kinase
MAAGFPKPSPKSGGLRAVLAGGIFLVVGIALVGGWAIVDSRRVTLRNAVQSSENLAAALQHDISRNIELYDLSLQTAIQGLRLPELWSLSPVVRQHILFDTAATAPHLGAMAITNERGLIQASSVADPTGRIDYSDRPYFKAHQADRDLGMLVTGPVRSRLTGEWAIAFSRRLEKEDGSFGGVVVGTLQLTFFHQLFERLDLGDGGGVSLFATDGRVIIRKPYNEPEIGRNVANAPVFVHLRDAGSGSFEGVSAIDGRTYLFAYAKIDGLPLVLTVRVPKDAVLAQWFQKSLVIGGIVAGLAALTLLLGLALGFELRKRGRAELAAREGAAALAAKSATLETTLAAMAAARAVAERARAEAETANEAKSTFLANMSHELRTPLNAVLGFSEVIREAAFGPVDARYREYARDIHAAGEHLLGVINDVLDLSKLEVDRLILSEETVDLAETLVTCSRIIVHHAESEAIRVEIDVAPGLPKLRGDRLRLKQIVINLLSNAVKFTPPGGRVRLAAREEASGDIAILVADTGIGMRPDEVPIALEPFRQLESSLARRFDGTGLGLPLAVRLTELHGGTLSIETAPNEGTTVTVKLPAGRALREAA